MAIQRCTPILHLPCVHVSRPAPSRGRPMPQDLAEERLSPIPIRSRVAFGCNIDRDSREISQPDVEKNTERLADFFSEVGAMLQNAAGMEVPGHRLDEAVAILRRNGNTQAECKKEIYQMIAAFCGQKDIDPETMNEALVMIDLACVMSKTGSEGVLESQAEIASDMIKKILFGDVPTDINAVKPNALSVHSGHGGRPNTSGKAAQHSLLSELKKLNDDKEMMYANELRQLPDAENINQEITHAVEQFGFKRPNDKSYLYSGDNPALALRNLLSVRPLVLDCDAALCLLNERVLLNSLGDALFNVHIKEKRAGNLFVGPGTRPPWPSDRVGYYCARHETNENPLPKNLQSGDHLWIQGPADGFVFHPDSDSNAFHVLVEMNGAKQPSLIGFDHGAKFHGHWTYPELRDDLLETYNSSLTRGDLKWILAERHNKTFTAAYSRFTFADAFEWLMKEQPKAMMRAIALLFRSNGDPDQKMNLYPPASDAIRGVRIHDRFRDFSSVADLMAGQHSLSSVTWNPDIPLHRNFSGLIEGFKTNFPHQRQIYAAIDAFYNRCIDARADADADAAPQFDGLVLYGDTGTGKSMACQALVRRLEEKNRVIWKTDFSEGENNTLLSPEEETQLLTTLRVKGEVASYEAVIEKFKPVWDKADALCADGIGPSFGPLMQVGRAMVYYASQRKMPILITCSGDPIKVFAGNIKYPIDSLVIRHIKGPKYEAKKSLEVAPFW